MFMQIYILLHQYNFKNGSYMEILFTYYTLWCRYRSNSLQIFDVCMYLNFQIFNLYLNLQILKFDLKLI